MLTRGSHRFQGSVPIFGSFYVPARVFAVFVQRLENAENSDCLNYCLPRTGGEGFVALHNTVSEILRDNGKVAQLRSDENTTVPMN